MDKDADQPERETEMGYKSNVPGTHTVVIADFAILSNRIFTVSQKSTSY